MTGNFTGWACWDVHACYVRGATSPSHSAYGTNNKYPGLGFVVNAYLKTLQYLLIYQLGYWVLNVWDTGRKREYLCPIL
jgi:hypothetical protein